MRISNVVRKNEFLLVSRVIQLYGVCASALRLLGGGSSDPLFCVS